MITNDYETSFVWDEPIDYKGFMLHPITMKDGNLFIISTNAFLLPKNRSKNIKIIKMSYFDYLFHYAQTEKDCEIYLLLTSIFLGLAFNGCIVDLGYLDGKNIAIIKKTDSDEELILDSVEFEAVKELILKQNKIELDEPILDESLEKELKKARELKNKLNASDEPELEELIVFLMLYWKMSLNDIKNMSLRKFNIALERITLFEDFKIYKTAELNGCEFKHPITHWLSKVKKSNKYDDVTMSQDSVKSKLGDVAQFK